MLRTGIARVAANPMAYELIQRAVGGRGLDRVLASLIDQYTGGKATGVVADVGGGTGRARVLWPRGWTYLCLDSDPAKLNVRHMSEPSDRYLVADATQMPLDDRSCDAVLLKFVSHHLDDGELGVALKEVRRVLTPRGVLIVVDAVWRPARVLSRILWRYDRGSFPRTLAALREHVAGEFDLIREDEFAAIHAYVAFAGRPGSGSKAT